MLWPNRRKQFQGHLIPFSIFGGGLVLAISALVGWVDPATRIQRGAIWGILLVTPFVLYRLAEQLLRPVIRVKATGIVWWTIQRSSGEVPADQVFGMRITGDGRDQAFEIRSKRGILDFAIQPVEDPDRFISAAFERLQIAPTDWPDPPPDSAQ